MKSSAHGGLPRWFDASAAALGILATFPLMALCAIAVFLSDGRPVIFTQSRVGRGGAPFQLRKFRSMTISGRGPQVTTRGDERITAVGRALRRWKLDELPQLWNVLVGDMALVGPRPEVPKYVDAGDPLWNRILSVRPGLTDPATLELRNEEAILQQMAGDTERNYLEKILPAKLHTSAEYLDARTWWTDFSVLCKTVAAFVAPRTRPPDSHL